MRFVIVMTMLLVGCGTPPKARPAAMVVVVPDSTNSQKDSPGAHQKGEAESAPASRPESVSGRLEPAIIQRVVRSRFDDFRRCYEASLVKDPNLTTRVGVRFVIGRNGKVPNIAARPTHVNGAAPDGASAAHELAKEVAACVESAFRTLTFPQPRGGIVTVSYPIVFSSAGEN